MYLITSERYLRVEYSSVQFLEQHSIAKLQQQAFPKPKAVQAWGGSHGTDEDPKGHWWAKGDTVLWGGGLCRVFFLLKSDGQQRDNVQTCLDHRLFFFGR